MMRVLVVEKIDENPLTVLGSRLIDQDAENLVEVVGGLVRSHNERAVVKADGALAWATEGSQRTIEFRLFGEDLRAIEPCESYSLHGAYDCFGSGARYKYYGSYTAFTSGRESIWEAHVFHRDKKFRNDGVLNSPDLLVRLTEPLPNIRMDQELLRALVVHRVENAIERWDAARGGSNSAGFDN